MKIKPTETAGRVLMELGPDEPKLMAQAPNDLLKVKKILVPMDFSECSEKALQYAIAFADQFQASLTLLYVIEIHYSAGEAAIIDLEKTKNEMIEEGKTKLATLAKRAPKATPARGIVETGNPYNEIVRLAREMETDLIIMSTHGRSGLTRFFIGSTTEKVVRHAPCPVLVVREQEHDFVDSSEEIEPSKRHNLKL